MEIITLPIDKIKPYAKNAKQHPEWQIEQIMQSIQQYGVNDPVAIWGAKNTVVEGHGRLEALKRLGYTEVPCIRLDHLSDKERREYALVHNKLNMDTGFDLDILADELDGLDFGELELDWGIEGEDEPPEVTEDDYDPEPPAEPKARLGDIYQLGRHRLMCGNSLNREEVEKLLDGAKCELTFTDPPYEIGSPGGGIVGCSNSMAQIKKNRVDTFDPSEIIILSDTNIYCHNKPLIKKYIELAEENGLAYDLCFYKKLCTVPNYKGHMMTDCEYIAVIGKQDPNKGLEKEMYSKCYIGKKDAENELSYSKPVGLCAKYIKLYSKKNVLDLFGGSGSTLIACEQTGRTCYMMELDPRYIDVILDRYEQFTGEKAVKIEG